MMRHTLLLKERNLVGDDGQAMIHLHGVAIDDLTIETCREIDG